MGVLCTSRKSELSVGGLGIKGVMSGKLHDLQKRMARVEQKLANIATAEELGKCNCNKMTCATPDRLDEFESEINRTCPVHEIRSLGGIISVGCSDPKDMTPEDLKLEQLLAVYDARFFRSQARLAQLRQVALRLKHDTQGS